MVIDPRRHLDGLVVLDDRSSQGAARVLAVERAVRRATDVIVERILARASE